MNILFSIGETIGWVVGTTGWLIGYVVLMWIIYSMYVIAQHYSNGKPKNKNVPIL